MKNKFVKIIVALVNVFAALFFVTFFLLLLLALFNRADLASMRFMIIVLANISSMLIFLVTSRLLRGPKTVKEPVASAATEPDDVDVEEEEESAVPDRMITMRDGYMCELVNNGTELHFAGNGTLGPDSGYFAPYAWDIAKIVIDGYDRVAPHTFEGFFNCREVEFSVPEVHVDSMAFAHCFALCRVKADRCDLTKAEDAFFDTLYDIGSWNKAGTPVPGDGAGQYIAAGPCGREFLEFM